MRTHPRSKTAFLITRISVAISLFFAAGLMAFYSVASDLRQVSRPHSASSAAAVNAAGQPPFATVENTVTAGGLTVLAKMFATKGKVAPGETFPVVLIYEAPAAPVAGVTISVTLHSSAEFQSSTPAASSGNGTAASPLVYNLGAVSAAGQIVIEARAKDLTQDPEIMWKDLSSNVTLTAGGEGPRPARTHGPKVTTLESAVYGDRPFPIVMVQYQDLRHCVGDGVRANPVPGGPPVPATDCFADHNAAKLDEAVNSRTSGKSVWQLFQDMSFGQLYPDARVNPAPAAPDTAYDVSYAHKFSAPAPGGTCTGTTTGPAYGPGFAVRNRVENGWYLLPGDQRYYGQDRTGHALLGAQTGQGVLFGVDDACGPTGKITYDAASLADPDIDYNDFDTDKDGVVDFFNVLFAGDGGNGSTTPSGLNNIWPHSSDLRQYFKDTNGQTGYVSNDQFRNRLNEPMFWTNASRTEMTTDPASGLKVFVRVGPYNVNPEAAIDSVSVIAHEYGHSLGLPDFYSTGSRATFGSWELMGSDHFQYMTVFSRQDMGWVVPRPLPDGLVTLKESKFDTGEIHWTRPDGTPYTLTGPGIHNADVYRVAMPSRILIDKLPDPTPPATTNERAWYSGSGNDFGCPNDGGGHNLDIVLPELVQHEGDNLTLKIRHLYEIEWDFDYAFVLISRDGGETWTSLPSQNLTTTPAPVNPNANGCQTTYGNSFTGVSDGDPTNDPEKRALADYSGAVFVEDTFDVSAYAGDNVILRFSYSTDPGLAKRGWFIDSMEITAGSEVVYRSSFEEDEQSLDRTKIHPTGWNRVTAGVGAPMDHAYYIELRDRISNDFNGKGQSDRGPPGWEAGVSMIYTDEAHGYGNFGTDDPPAQTPVDSNPEPGNATPNLDDAAFTLGRPQFNACTHVENYDAEPGAEATIPWKLPGQFRFNVIGMSGMSPGEALPPAPATATLVAELFADCNLQIIPPTLGEPLQYENPDTDGQYQMVWTRPAGAVGPDTLQIASTCGAYFTENADDISDWTVSQEGTYVGLNWSVTTDEKPHHSGSTFRARAAFGGAAPGPNSNASAILKHTAPIAIPATGSTTLTWQDWNINEGDDGVFVEVAEDKGEAEKVWNIVHANSRSALAPDAVTAFESEPMVNRQVDLTTYAGKSIHLRFRYYLGLENRAGSEPQGWYVDNISIANAQWEDVITTANNSHLEQRPTGSYCYRVRTTYPAGGGLPILPSQFSNVVTVNVAEGVTLPPRSVFHFSAATYSVAENGGNATITVTRSGGTAAGATVNYTTSDGSANFPDDYTGTSGTLTFAPGEASRNFTVTVIDDGHAEGDETVNLSLSNPAGGAVGSPAAAVLTILDNDSTSDSPGALQFSASAYTAAENAGSARITVTRTNGSAGTVTVSFATSDGSATDKSDYTSVSGTLTFGPGEVTKTFDIPLVDERTAEQEETVVLTLSNPTAGATLGNPSSATLTIIDVDRSDPPAQLLNISTRLPVRGGDNVGIAGFIITGSGDKRILVRGIGPSLTSDGQPVEGRLQDPAIELYDGNGQLITANNNWKESPERAAIEASGLAPQHDAEAAIARTLQPGVYTAIVFGENGSEGIALVEAYDRDRGGSSEMANISTRGRVETGDNVLIAGFIAGARNSATDVIMRAIGPSLTGRGVPDALDDPSIVLVDANGQIVESNEDWKNSPDQSAIAARGLAPSDDRESAALAAVGPGNYTAVVRGRDNTSGVALVEIYNVR